MSIERNIGRFKIHKELIIKNPAVAFTVLSTVIPVRAEYMFEDDSIHYTAISHSFTRVEEGRIAPEYRVVVSNINMVHWERVNE